jgi:DNA-binding response OmpR family regulator
MKILIVDDNLSLAERIRDRIAPYYVTDIVTTGRAAIVQATAHDYGVILLDLNLPDIHGLEVCQLLRSRGVNSPVLVLTADDSIKSHISLLDAGADDFLVKPFNSEELRARIGALLRRPVVEAGDDILTVGPLTLDSRLREVHEGVAELMLTRKEFDILEYLLRNKGHIRTRAQIFNYAWNGDSTSMSGAVDVHIKHLRDKLGASGTIIHTVHGIGYKVDSPKVVNIGRESQ